MTGTQSDTTDALSGAGNGEDGAPLNEHLAALFDADVMVEKVDDLYWCPDCPTYSTAFALAFAHHRRTVPHATEAEDG